MNRQSQAGPRLREISPGMVMVWTPWGGQSVGLMRGEARTDRKAGMQERREYRRQGMLTGEDGYLMPPEQTN
jgi:hypothetical protein